MNRNEAGQPAIVVRHKEWKPGDRKSVLWRFQFSNFRITGNNIDDHLRHGIVIENSMGNTVSGNMIEECIDTGLVPDRDVYATTVASNIFIHNEGGGKKKLTAPDDKNWTLAITTQ